MVHRRSGELVAVGRACVVPCSGKAEYINRTTIEVDGRMLPEVFYESGLNTIPDLL